MLFKFSSINFTPRSAVPVVEFRNHSMVTSENRTFGESVDRTQFGESDFMLQPIRMHNFIISNQSECFIPVATTTVPNVGESDFRRIGESDFRRILLGILLSFTLKYCPTGVLRKVQ